MKNKGIIFIILFLAFSQKSISQMLEYDQYVSQLKEIKLQDGLIKYADEGEGPVILLVHGVPTNSWLYRKIGPSLVKAGYRVIIPDMLGFGQSDKPKDEALYTAEKHGSRLNEFMGLLQIDSWTHVCHDAGSYWSLSMLQQNMEGPAKIVFLNSIMLQDGFNPPMTFKPGLFTKIIMSFYGTAINPLLVNGTLKKGIKDRSVINKKMKKGYSKALRKGSTKAIYHFFSQTSKPLEDHTATLKNIKVPVSIIWGKDDPFLIWENIEEQFKPLVDIKSEDIHILDAAHFIQEEKPDQISTIIEEFITNN